MCEWADLYPEYEEDEEPWDKALAKRWSELESVRIFHDSHNVLYVTLPLDPPVFKLEKPKEIKLDGKWRIPKPMSCDMRKRIGDAVIRSIRNNYGRYEEDGAWWWMADVLDVDALRAM